jgi:Domain of unknown function (DUF4150)
MSAEVLARKASGWRIIGMYPDVCKTPMGKAMVPVPYPVSAQLDSSVSTVKNVKANGEPVVVFNKTQVPSTKGDTAGIGKGLKSGTVGAACWPKTHSGTVRAAGQYVVRHDDEFWMNG